MPHILVTASSIEVIRRGGLVIFPTETLYGLGCVVTNEDALRRLFQIKGRAPGQPPPVLVADEEQLRTLVEHIPASAVDLIDKYWPGPLTLVLPARDEVPMLLMGITADGSIRTIGVRRSAHPVAQTLCEEVGAPIVATSANLSGATGRGANPRCIADIPASLQESVDVLIDGGVVGGEPSTVVDCTCDPPHVLRHGASRL